MKKKILSKHAPAALGPYSQAIVATGTNQLFVSGQLPIDPISNRLIDGDIRKLTTRVLQNIEAILLEAGYLIEDVVQVSVFLRDLNDFAEMNEAYKDFFKNPPFPARQTIEVSALPLGASIEIACIAIKTLI